MSADAQPAPQGPHPLAVALAATLVAGDTVIVLGDGSTRNFPPFVAKGIDVVRARSAGEIAQTVPVAGILSTHALLHGTRATVTAAVERLAGILGEGGALYATFGSTADPRCGAGSWVEGEGWSPTAGAEAGVAHAYFDRAQLERLLIPFSDTFCEQRDVRTIAGRWAHAPDDADHPSVHWFVRAYRRGAAPSVKPLGR